MAGDGRDGKEEGECQNRSQQLLLVVIRARTGHHSDLHFLKGGMESGSDRLRRWDSEKDALVQKWNEPLRELYTRYDKDAYDVAKLLIQSLLFLHAGALVAIPAYNSLQEPRLAQTSVTCLVAIFSFGIVSALASGIFAFFAMSSRADHSWTLSGCSEHKAWAKILREEFFAGSGPKFQEMAESYSIDAQKIEGAAEEFQRSYLKFRTLGIVSVLLSGAALIVAALVAASSIGSSDLGRSDYQIQFGIHVSW
jgi:hypothetical protein